jgi:protein TonB
VFGVIWCGTAIASENSKQIIDAYNKAAHTEPVCAENVCTTSPIILEMDLPKFPEDAWKSGKRGTAVLIFTVDEHGHVVDPDVEKASYPEFIAPSLEAIRKFRFEPAKANGKPVRTRLRIPFAFL